MPQAKSKKPKGEMLGIRYVPLKQALRWDRNPKPHDIGALIQSFKRYGFKAAPKYEPVLNDGEGGIVDGNGRHEALEIMRADGEKPPRGIGDLGDDWAVPLQFGVDAKSQAEAEAYAIDANALTVMGGDFGADWMTNLYSEDGLKDVLLDLADLGELPVSMDGDDLDALINKPPVEAPDAQIDKAEELLKVWPVERGQVWQVGKHRVMCGDCTTNPDTERLLGGESPDLCLTDPPYGLDEVKASGKNNYENFDDSKDSVTKMAGKWLPIVRDTCAAVVFSPGVTRQWIYPEPDWVLCWFYGGGQLRSPWGFNCWQPFLCYGKDPSLANGRGARPDAVDMNTPANAQDIDHPCPKPLKLWEWMILRLTFTDDASILDPFIGSGTTMVAAEQLGRVCYGMEIEPKYVAVTLQRMADMGLTPELADG